MKRFLICVLIGALLSIIIAALLLPQVEWEQLAQAYNDGKITREEYRRAADKLIKRSPQFYRKRKAAPSNASPSPSPKPHQKLLDIFGIF